MFKVTGISVSDNWDCANMYSNSRRSKRKESSRRREAMGYKVTLIKGKNNMVGISIGGGSPFCPCLYVVQVFHRTPAAEGRPAHHTASARGTRRSAASASKASANGSRLSWTSCR